jgi:putative NADH-flavin reductase
MGGIYQRSQREGAADRAEQERLVKESDLEWTLIKPPRLTNGPRSKRFRAGPDLRVGLLSLVSMADVAAFTLSEILDPKHIREAVFVVG